MDQCILVFRCQLIFLFLILLFSSCEQSNSYIDTPLEFSEDTIHFDTVFTSIGSTSRELRVINREKSKLTIDEIYLSGGWTSSFRLNIDGEPVYRKEGITLYPKDSIFIFVDVNIDPTNESTPVAVMDSIIFRISGLTMQVQLLAWGQDIYLLNNEIIKTETWNKSKPYLIYGNVTVDAMETLTIEQGAKVYFHKNASFIIAGNLKVNGAFGSPVLFASDRLEKEYMDIPGQWRGIYIMGSGNGNEINYSIIRNSIFGLTIGGSSSTGAHPELKLLNTELLHSTVSGLSAVNSRVEAANCIFSHCGQYCIYLASGGDYSFTHCTVSNLWDYGFRMTPAVSITEKSVGPAGSTSLLNVDLNNSVVYGDLKSEVEITPLAKSFTGDYYFDHCLLKLDTINSVFWTGEKFPGAVINKDPLFIDPLNYDFRPDTLSPLIDQGSDLYKAAFPLDIRNVSRISDSKPDIGAYERVKGEKKEIR